MRHLLILAIVTMSMNVKAAKITNNDLDKVLTTIDNLCADTWCEGDYNYSFSKLECSNNNTCKLSFRIIDGDKEKMSNIKTCKLTGIKSTKDMMAKGYLTESFNEQVDQCLTNTKF